MNKNRFLPAAALEGLETRVGLRMAAQLDDSAAALPADVSERLRFARQQALARARVSRRAEGTLPVAMGHALAAGRLGGPASWLRVASVLPLVVLVAGLVAIQQMNSSTRVSAAAEVDAALLSDDVPPTAYGDPGFVEFLKTPRD